MTKKKKPAEQAAGDEPSFEQSLQKLEEIVRQLEDGRLGLSESLARYEEAVQHLERCYEALRKAERKIELLAGVDAEGNPITQPFDDPSLSLEEKQRSRSRRRSRSSPKPATAEPEVQQTDVDEPKGLF